MNRFNKTAWKTDMPEKTLPDAESMWGRVYAKRKLDKKRRIKVEKKSFEEKIHTYERDMHDARQESGVLLSMEMEKSFKRLKPKQRMLLWLAYVEGYSYSEIAQMTDTKENSLKVQLFRAREKLANILKTQEQEGRTQT
jgi:RNA polymerase sigma factor (sigma-70 family)